MSSILLYTILSLCAIGVVSAVILFFVAKKFHIDEDPLVREIESVLPGVNCGGCGYPGCHGFAEACVTVDSLDGYYCAPGGNETMAEVARILGKNVAAKDPMIAVVRCNGTLHHRQKTAIYDGAKTCAIAAATFSSDTGCEYGCLGLADCVAACPFDAIHMNPETGLPVIDENKCTACGKCVTACPKAIIELRKKGLKGRRVYVCCINKDKGGPALKACKAACIGCGKCVKECPFDAIVLANNLAYIDFEKCKLCRKCVAVCPTKAIHEVNFPPREEKKDENKPTAQAQEKD